MIRTTLLILSIVGLGLSTVGWLANSKQYTYRNKPLFIAVDSGCLEVSRIGIVNYDEVQEWEEQHHAKLFIILEPRPRGMWPYFTANSPYFTGVLPLWVPTMVSLGVFVAILSAYARRAHRVRLGLCVECGYSLVGLTSSVCPECGHDMESES